MKKKKFLYLKIFVLVGFVTFVMFCACSEKKDDVTSYDDSVIANIEACSDYFQENMALYDVLVRSTSEESFVKELYLVNLSDGTFDLDGLGYNGNLYRDNGQGFDEIAGDGLFTSVNEFAYNDSIKYIEGEEIQSLLESPIVDQKFIQTESLKLFKSSNIGSSLKNGPIFTVTCDLKIVSTGCVADWVWSGFGCLSVSNCTTTIGWGK